MPEDWRRVSMRTRYMHVNRTQALDACQKAVPLVLRISAATPSRTGSVIIRAQVA
jgi:hypothetical protein